jgi:esterase
MEIKKMLPIRKYLNTNNCRISYIDFGGDGVPILALHGHYGCARMFAELAKTLSPKWRVIAIDQRGHGWSDKPDDYTREAYVNDLIGIIDTLNLAPIIVLGHSLGGINAFQFAARFPGAVRAMIVEDIGANNSDCPTYIFDGPARFDSITQLLDFLKSKDLENDPYFLASLIEYPDGWGFQFRYDHMFNSQQLLHGDWTEDWLASICPALLLHGHKSWVLKTDHAREMTKIRPDTRLVEFPNSGHTIHDDAPEEFSKAVIQFLETL